MLTILIEKEVGARKRKDPKIEMGIPKRNQEKDSKNLETKYGIKISLICQSS